MPPIRQLLLTGIALIAAASLTGCGGAIEPTRSDSESSDAPRSNAPSSPAESPSAEQPTPSAPALTESAGKAPVGNPKPDGNRWKINLASDGANTDPKTWPDAGEVFSEAEITSVIPSTTDVNVTECQKGKFLFGPNSGKQTPRNVSCYYEITSDLQAYDDQPLRLFVSFSGFLSRDEARDRFDSSKASQKKAGTKYPDQWMDLGKDSYWTGSSSQVYVGNGSVGGTFQLGASGSIAGEDDYMASKRRLRDELEVPFAKIVQSKL
ncbi:hypothetical protein [Tenggerimyces flavus]|nr:hypothetical protein [Tenggerimyces flavus]MBM7790150.1 hypothetical protein [Tenggerimyces flavus]